MFGLTALETKLAGAAIALLVLLIVVGGFAWHERSLGAAKCVQADAKAVSAQEAHNATVEAQGTTTVFQEASDFHEATSAPIAHPVQLRVCNASPRGSLPDSGSTGPIGHDSPALPGSSDGAAVQGESVGPKLQELGRDADAQVRELQDYIVKVCRVR